MIDVLHGPPWHDARRLAASTERTQIEDPELLPLGERFYAHLHGTWVRCLTEAHRGTGSRTLLTCGYDQHTVALRRRYPNISVRDGADLLDFLSVHIYPKAPLLDRALNSGRC